MILIIGEDLSCDNGWVEKEAGEEGQEKEEDENFGKKNSIHYTRTINVYLSETMPVLGDTFFKK